MNTSRSSPGMVGFSVKIYRWMLQAYPSGFHSQYSAPMTQVFRDCCLHALQQEGPPGLVLLWLRTLLDYVKTMIEQHSRGGIQMMNERFFRFSGWAFIAGSLAFLTGFLASNRPEFDPRNAAALPIDRLANAVSWPALGLGVLLIAVGLAGLLARFGPRSQLVRIGGTAGLLGGVVGLAGFVGMFFAPFEPAWYMFFYGIAGLFLGITIFGVGAVRQHLLPGVSGLPIVAGISFPTFLLIGAVYELFTGRWIELSTLVSSLIFGVTTIGLAALGVRMQSKDLSTDGLVPGD